jgi:hypothetical protein
VREQVPARTPDPSGFAGPAIAVDLDALWN